MCQDLVYLYYIALHYIALYITLHYTLYCILLHYTLCYKVLFFCWGGGGLGVRDKMKARMAKIHVKLFLNC